MAPARQAPDRNKSYLPISDLPGALGQAPETPQDEERHATCKTGSHAETEEEGSAMAKPAAEAEAWDAGTRAAHEHRAMAQPTSSQGTALSRLRRAGSEPR